MLKDTDVREAFVLLRGMGVAPPDGANVQVLIALWLAHLGHLEPGQLKAAATLWGGRSRFWPTPAELKAELAKAIPASTTSADGAWVALLEAVRRHGSYSPPKCLGGNEWDFPEHLRAPMAMQVRAVGGWKAVCLWNEDELQHHKRRWVEDWATGSKRAEELEAGQRALSLLADRGLKLLKGGAE